MRANLYCAKIQNFAEYAQRDKHRQIIRIRGVNRLFYLVPDFFKSNLRIFIFYEENTFLKDSKQNLKLIQSNLKIQYNKTEYLTV